MTDAVRLLQAMGLGEHEARAYESLLQHNPVTGYELAKVSGIPRPNVYPVLQKLEERGLALRVESEGATHYVPAPPEEFLDRIDKEFAGTIDEARRVLPGLTKPVEREQVWNAEGYANMVAQARALIHGARERLLVALWPDEARLLADALDDACARDIEITTLCMAACPQECGGCRGSIHRHRVLDTEGARWLLVVPDGREVLAGEVPGIGVQAQGGASLVRTRQRLHVDLVGWFIRHSIALAALLMDASAPIGAPLGAPLEERTVAALDAAGPEGAGGWLSYMHRLLDSAG